MDYEVKRLHARINALEIALVAALKNDPDASADARHALDAAYDEVVKIRSEPASGGFPTSVKIQPRASTDNDAEELRLTTIDALRKKLG